MAAIASVELIANKWARVTPQRSEDYRLGVTNPQRNWEQNTKAANDAWKEGTAKAIAEDRFTKGVSRAGQAKWQLGATTKGVTRWPEGVRLGEDAYRTGFAPFQQAIERLTLPPRFARRDPRNLLRVEAVVNALKAVKEGLGG